MAGIGRQLESTRRMHNLSIEQVAADTRISARFIQALEDEQFDVLPAPVYVRGFLRSYANYLRMDPQPLLDELSRYEEADGYVVRGPAPWRGPAAGARPSQRGPSNDPFRPRPPAPSPVEQTAGLAPLPTPIPGTNGSAEHTEWEPELDELGESDGYAGDSYDDYVYEEQPAWVDRQRDRPTQGVLLEKPVALRDGSGPPRLGIAIAVLAVFGAAAIGAFFVFRGGDDGGVAAGQDGGEETPAADETPASVVEVRTPTPTQDSSTSASPAPGSDGTPGATPSVSPTPGQDETPAASTTTPQPTQPLAEQPTVAPTAFPTATPTVQVFPTATPEPPTPTATAVPPTATPTEAIVHPLGTSLCGTGVDPCGAPPLIVVCGPNGWFIDPSGSYVNMGWPVGSASRIGEADSVC